MPVKLNGLDTFMTLYINNILYCMQCTPNNIVSLFLDTCSRIVKECCQHPSANVDSLSDEHGFEFLKASFFDLYDKLLGFSLDKLYSSVKKRFNLSLSPFYARIITMLVLQVTLMSTVKSFIESSTELRERVDLLNLTLSIWNSIQNKIDQCYNLGMQSLFARLLAGHHTSQYSPLITAERNNGFFSNPTLSHNASREDLSWYNLAERLYTHDGEEGDLIKPLAKEAVDFYAVTVKACIDSSFDKRVWSVIKSNLLCSSSAEAAKRDLDGLFRIILNEMDPYLTLRCHMLIEAIKFISPLKKDFPANSVVQKFITEFMLIYGEKLKKMLFRCMVGAGWGNETSQLVVVASLLHDSCVKQLKEWFERYKLTEKLMASDCSLQHELTAWNNAILDKSKVSLLVHEVFKEDRSSGFLSHAIQVTIDGDGRRSVSKVSMQDIFKPKT